MKQIVLILTETILNKHVRQVNDGMLVIGTSAHRPPYTLASIRHKIAIRGGYVWGLHYFYLNTELESHTKYTGFNSNMITVHVERLSTKLFNISNEWEGHARGQGLEVCMI